MSALFPVPQKTEGTQVLVGFSVCFEVITRCGVVPRNSRCRPMISKILTVSRQEYVGGTSYDVAVATEGTFGLKSFLVGSVAANSNELERQFIVSQIEDMGIPFHPLTVRTATSVGNIIIEGDEDPFIYSFKPGYQRTPISEVRDLVKSQQPSIVVATGVMPEEIEMVETMFSVHPDIPRFLNPRAELIKEPTFFARALRLNPIVFINHEELGIFLHQEIPEGGVTREHTMKLHELGAHVIIVTCNESGAVMSIGNQSELLKQPARRFGKPVDKTGAGDSFLSGCIAAIFDGKDAREILHYGATAAGLKVLREGGANVPNAQEFSNAL